ncbi:alpha/beta fold hydrolase [Micromonospora sp. NBC_01796]|uniref:alpha/beta fold hydrolase n=1 Tax=Micromonospora sp. NBC_01796 TaxID=2975987 RepID=UPI002DD81127|nr:alpha/beta hydrolase [Micromonospora sp. NBC_01796]WSA84618.1 alpha/beta hydrolase [Micromonospora sp. NBC_01796]
MRLNINGNELEVEVFGADDAPVLIAHHGAPGLGSRSEPRATFSPFADTFRVIVFDARGSGVSEGNGPFSHEQWVADVDGLREWAGVERFVMAGGSYGGFISMEYAIRHPERVRALVLRDTSADHENDKAARHNAETSTRVTIDLEKLDRINTGQTRDDADLRDCWQEILPLYDHVYDPAKVAERVEATPYRYETHNYAFSVNMPNYDIKSQLHRITCPTLVTVGRDDWITPVASSEVIASLIPDARLVVFEKSGHSPQIEEAQRWRQVVRDFLHEIGADEQ